MHVPIHNICLLSDTNHDCQKAGTVVKRFFMGKSHGDGGLGDRLDSTVEEGLRNRKLTENSWKAAERIQGGAPDG